MLAEKLKELLAALDKPRNEINEMRAAAMACEIQTLIEEAKDVPVEVFAVFAPEVRCAALSIVLGIILSALVGNEDALAKVSKALVK